MTIAGIEQQEHGYRNGHQLLSASVRLPREDQDTVDRLSDIAGGLRPDEQFSAYLTAYPLPSRSHYVLARTWQDLNARRAGCVLTRSLLIPMDMWERTTDLGYLVSLLTPIAMGNEPISSDGSTPVWPPPPARDRRSVELAEALFLEKRQSIVVFDAADAEVMAIRVLAALWPGLRHTFALCSFALGPRQINGRDFDLLLAPKSARSRFANWSGRKIDTDVHQARHRWSASIAAQIFESMFPSLTTIDTLGLLGRDISADESALRLTLMWNELALKAQSAPTAVLGMLDIANSLNEISPAAAARLEELVNHATDMVVTADSTADGWEFLKALLGKYSTRLLMKPLIKRVRSTATALATRDIATAEEFLLAKVRTGQRLPSPIMAGIGRGLSTSADPRNLPAYLLDLPSDVRLKLFTQSPSLIRLAIAQSAEEPSRWMDILTEMLTSADLASLVRIRRNIFSFLTSRTLAPILPALLKHSTASELKRLVIGIGRTTHFSIEEFDEPLVNAARDAASLDTLRHAIADNYGDDGADRFLLKTFRLDPTDLSWLCGGEIEPARSRRIALNLIENAPDRDIRAVQRNDAVLERVLLLLVGGLPHGASQIARLLSLGEWPLDVFLDTGLAVIGLSKHIASIGLSSMLLERAFAESPPGDSRVAQVLDLVGVDVGPRNVIRRAVPSQGSVQRVSENVTILERARPEVRLGILSHVDELCDRLITRGRNRMPEHANLAWSKLIADAGKHDRNSQLNAAISTLAYALPLGDAPVSRLIIQAFPIVYTQLLQSKGEDDFRSIPSLLALPMSFFKDWDRAKSARQDLIRAYLHSEWPPTDLLLTAINAGIDQEVLARLDRDERGRRYIVAVEKSADQLGVEERDLVRKRLSVFRLTTLSGASH